MQFSCKYQTHIQYLCIGIENLIISHLIPSITSSVFHSYLGYSPGYALSATYDFNYPIQQSAFSNHTVECKLNSSYQTFMLQPI